MTVRPQKKLHPGQQPPNWVRPDGSLAKPRKISMLGKVGIGVAAVSWASVVAFAVTLNLSGARPIDDQPSPEVASSGPSAGATAAALETASTGSSAPAASSLAASDAGMACMDAARDRIIHPSTADFSILGSNFKSFDDGTSIFTTTFTARNSFNLELEYQVACDFTGTALTEVTIAEAR